MSKKSPHTKGKFVVCHYMGFWSRDILDMKNLFNTRKGAKNFKSNSLDRIIKLK